MVQYLHFSILKLPLIRGTWESMGYNLYNCRISRFYGIVEVFDRFCWITTIGVSVGSITLVFGVSITGWWLSHLPLRKMMELKSVGMMTFPTEWKNKKCSKPPTSNWWWYTHWYWWASYGDFMGFFMGCDGIFFRFNGIQWNWKGLDGIFPCCKAIYKSQWLTTNGRYKAAKVGGLWHVPYTTWSKCVLQKSGFKQQKMWMLTN